MKAKAKIRKEVENWRKRQKRGKNRREGNTRGLENESEGGSTTLTEDGQKDMDTHHLCPVRLVKKKSA